MVLESPLSFGLQGLDNLEELYLNSNKLIKIESNLFQYLNKLKIFDLNCNHIEHIYAYGFQGLDNLEELRFGGNPKQQIEPNLIQNMKKLKLI